jgi:hypothetical protein
MNEVAAILLIILYPVVLVVFLDLWISRSRSVPGKSNPPGFLPGMASFWQTMYTRVKAFRHRLNKNFCKKSSS